jgi:hypothetical protein
MSDVTQILRSIEQGEPEASEKLLPLVYDELKQLAGQRESWTDAAAYRTCA